MKHYYCYVGGALSKPLGFQLENCGRAYRAANELLRYGAKHERRLIPVVPHASVFWELFWPPRPESHKKLDDYDLWLPYDFAFLEDVCNSMLRVTKHYSPGADNEEKKMEELGKPVFFSVADVIADYEEWRQREEREERRSYLLTEVEQSDEY